MKKIISISIIIAIIISALIYYFNFHYLSIQIKQSDLIVNIYKSDKKIKTLTKDDKFIIQDGEYYYVIENEKISNNKNYFKVNKNLNILIDPVYSQEYLLLLLSSEQENISQIIYNTYPFINNNYIISNETLFNKGEWFGALIHKDINRRDITDLYRIVLKKIDNKWVIIRYPEILITKTNYQTVPGFIIDSVNNFERL